MSPFGWPSRKSSRSPSSARGGQPLQILAYCLTSVGLTVWRATTVIPITSPPFSHRTFPAQLMDGMSFIWLGLHGLPDDPDYLYGDEVSIGGLPLRIKALHVDQIQDLNLSGAVVFATSCYLPSTNFPAAFKKAGAQVIGGSKKNYGSRSGKLRGADALGAQLIQTNTEDNLVRRLNTAKNLSLIPDVYMADADAMEFRIL